MPRTKKEDNQFHYAGFSTPNGTVVPDDVFDLLLPHLTDIELRVLLYIIRRTFGFKRDSDNISLKQIVQGITTRDGRTLDQGAGVSKPSAIKAARLLEGKGIIARQSNSSAEKGDEATTYTLRFRPDPLSIPLTRGGKSGLPAGVNRVDTQQTGRQQTVQQQDDDDIRGALEVFGVSAGQAQRLAETYPPALVLEKLDQVSYLVERRSSLVSRNPQGFLIKAIEENYLPEKPQGYKTKAEREAQAQQRQELEAELEQARLDREHTITAYKQQQQPKAIPGTTLTTATSWEQTLQALQGQMTTANFNTWLKHTVLVDCQQGTALIAAPSIFVAEWLQARMVPLVKRALVETLGQPVELQFTVAPELTPSAEP